MRPGIHVIDGFILNPNTKHIDTVLRLISNNGGKCICHNESEDPYCPCSDYRFNKVCHCKLYLKQEDYENSKV